MSPVSLPDLDRRLRALERANRRWRYTALALAATAAIAWTAQRRPADDIETRALTLLDADGRVLAQLKSADGGPALLLFDSAGTVRASLAHNDQETALYLRDTAGDVRVGAAQFAHGGGGFALHGPQVKGAAVLYYKERGSLTFYGPDGEILHQVP